MASNMRAHLMSFKMHGESSAYLSVSKAEFFRQCFVTAKPSQKWTSASLRAGEKMILSNLINLLNENEHASSTWDESNRTYQLSSMS